MDAVIEDMEKVMGKSCWQFLGRGKVPYIADKLVLKGGGKPSERAVRAVLQRGKGDDWYIPLRVKTACCLELCTPQLAVNVRQCDV